MAFAMNGKLASRASERIRPGVKMAVMLKSSIFPNWLPANARISITGIMPRKVESIKTATRIEVSLSNTLTAYGDNGAVASIRKDAVAGLAIKVIPEPGTALLMGLGLAALATRRRDRA